MSRLGLGLGITELRGRRAFDPLALPGLAFLFDHRSEKRANADGTGALVTTNGTALRSWQDRTGNGNHVSTAGTPPILVVTNGDPCVRSSTTNQVLSRAWSPGAIAGDYSFHFVMQKTANDAACVCTFLGTGGNSFFGMPWTNDFPSIPGNTTGFGSSWIQSIGKAVMISQVRSGTTVTTYVNGVPVNTATNSTSFTPDIIQLFRYSTTSFYNFKLYSAAFAPGQAHTASEVSSYWSWMRSELPSECGRSSNLLVFVGNSLGTGQFAGVSGGNIVQKMIAGGLLPGFTHALNASVGAKTTEAMLADHATRIVPLADATTGRTVFVVWELTNSLAVGGQTPASAAASMFALAQGLRSAVPNSRVVVPTVIDRNVAGWPANKAAVNALVLDSGNQSTHGYIACDLTGIAGVSADGANSNAAVFAGDRVHLLGAGNDLIKAAIAATCEAALAS